jgi:hypothetical protein
MATRTAILGRSRAVSTSPASVDGLLPYAVAMAVGALSFTSSVADKPVICAANQPPSGARPLESG